MENQQPSLLAPQALRLFWPNTRVLPERILESIPPTQQTLADKAVS